MYVARMAGPRPKFLQSSKAPPPMVKRAQPQTELKTYRDPVDPQCTAVSKFGQKELHLIARACARI